MPLPPATQQRSAQLHAWLQRDPQHQITPAQRFALMQTLPPVAGVPIRNTFRGWLGVLTARSVLPLWEQVTPIWADIPADLPDTNLLPHQLIALAESLLQGAAETAAVWQEVNNQWYVVGNIGDEITEHRDDLPIAAYYVCDAALRALYETLHVDFLNKIPDQAVYSDATLPEPWRDSASCAVTALTANLETASRVRARREFWIWWLQDAVPMAWAYAEQ